MGRSPKKHTAEQRAEDAVQGIHEAGGRILAYYTKKNRHFGPQQSKRLKLWFGVVFRG